MRLNPNNLREETLRSSLFQFLGAIISSYPDPAQAIAIVLEELVKLASKDPNNLETGFQPELIKPMIKSVEYVTTIQYNNLLKDSQETFKNNIPEPIQKSLNNDKQMIELIRNYINRI